MSQNTLPSRRVLIKLSGESLLGEDSGIFDLSKANFLIQEIEEITALGVGVAIVIGAGNILRAKMLEDTPIERTVADRAGMLATTINGLLLKELFLSHKQKVQVMSAISLPSFCPSYQIEEARAALNEETLLIFTGGIGHPFFTTDTAAALRAREIEADLLIKWTKVGAIYSDDPKLSKTATQYSHITFQSVLEKRLQVMDQTAIALLEEANIPLHVVPFSKGSLKKATEGKGGGTLVTKH